MVAADLVQQGPTLDMLEFVRAELNLDPLIAAAIERGARARHTRTDQGK